MNEKGNKMKQYLVFQLPFEHSLKRDMSFLETFQIEELSDEYVCVAQVTANSLDEVFRIGNFVSSADQDFIEVTGEMHSISVGDIIADVQSGEEFVVAPFGFNKIVMKEGV